MAIGPDGVAMADDALGAPPLGAEALAFARGLEGIVDRALRRNPPGEVFVYGVYQEMEPEVAEYLRERYRAAGWSEVTVKPGATGAYLLVLAP